MTNIVYKRGLPPNYEAICEAFPFVRGNQDIIFTYGNEVFSNVELQDHLKVHEATHTRQQSKLFMTPKRWWKKYIEDKDFRFNQEVEAYRNQFEFIKDNLKDKNKLHLILRRLARDLSGPIYGNMVSLEKAMDVINNE